MATCLKSDYKVYFHDLALTPYSPEDTERLLQAEKPDVIGFQVYPDNWTLARDIISRARKLLPNVITVAGSSFATAVPKELMLEEPQLDYVVTHEAEEAFPELLAQLSKSSTVGLCDIPNIVSRDRSTGQVLQMDPRPPIEDLDALEFWDRSYLDPEDYTTAYLVHSARGCPGKCIFCAANVVRQGCFRTRSIETMLKEVAALVDRHEMKHFMVADDTFTAIPERVHAFCRGLKNDNHRGLRWACESRANVMTPKLAEAMYDAGCIRVQVGLESASNEILRKIRKGISVEQVENAVKCLSDVGILPMVSFMFGHAWDTKFSLHVAVTRHFPAAISTRTVIRLDCAFMRHAGINTR
jgi:radical SAM superfamily enzyme YgiQ (UPF0313 family)